MPRSSRLPTAVDARLALNALGKQRARGARIALNALGKQRARGLTHRGLSQQPMLRDQRRSSHLLLDARA